MGAQVIFAVNHAYLDRLDENCLNWLGLQASVHTDNPRTWLASEWDKHDRSNGRSRSAPDIRPALSFSYSDYQATNTILVSHDMILQMYGLYDLSFKEATEFPDLAKQIARKARYNQPPFTIVLSSIHSINLHQHLSNLDRGALPSLCTRQMHGAGETTRSRVQSLQMWLAIAQQASLESPSPMIHSRGST